MFTVLDHQGSNKNGLHSVATLGGGGRGLKAVTQQKKRRKQISMLIQIGFFIHFYPSVSGEKRNTSIQQICNSPPFRPREFPSASSGLRLLRLSQGPRQKIRTQHKKTCFLWFDSPVSKYIKRLKHSAKIVFLKLNMTYINALLDL